MKKLGLYLLFSLCCLSSYSQLQTEECIETTDAEIAKALCDTAFWNELFNTNALGAQNLIVDFQFLICSDYELCHECIEKNKWLQGPNALNLMFPNMVLEVENCSPEKLKINSFSLLNYHRMKKYFETN